MKWGVVVCLVVYLGVVLGSSPPPWDELWYNEQTVDHFNFEEYGDLTFRQRYLVYTKHWDVGKGPIFFYTGNEGSIEEFWNATGWVFDHSEEFGALVVFGEHRFYGKTWPFGTPEESFKDKRIGLLTVEQALADYAQLIGHIKKHFNTPKSKVISFGGSYGGMLSAWFRIKYPFVVHSALAASAPIKIATGGPEFKAKPGFFETVTNDYHQADPACPKLARRAFSEIIEYGKTEQGLKYLTEQFKLCKPLTKDNVEHLILWAVNSFGSLAMVDYPYPADFLAPLPAWPIKASCATLRDESHGTLLRRFADAAGLFYNGTTGHLKCYDIETEFVFCSDQTGCGVGNGGISWGYQACAEIIYFPNTNNVTDMFPPRTWTLDDLNDWCEKRYDVTPRPHWLATYYGGADLTGASRIIFSNGYLDPWHGGGFLESLSDTLVAIKIKEAAHHLDLRYKNQADPIFVVEARRKEADLLKKWLLED